MSVYIRPQKEKKNKKRINDIPFDDAVVLHEGKFTTVCAVD